MNTRTPLPLIGPILLILFLAAPNAVPLVSVADQASTSVSEGLAYAVIFWLFVWGVVGRAYFLAVIALLISLTWIGALGIRLVYHVPINQTYLSYLATSSLRELIDFLGSSNYSWPLFLSPIPIELMLFLSLRWRKARLSLPCKWRVFFIFFGLSVFGGLLVFDKLDTSGASKNTDEVNAINERPFHPFVDPLRAVYPLDVTFAVSDLIANESIISQLRAQLPVVKLSRAQPVNAPSLVILIIGESSNRNRWQIYGNERETTPELKGRVDQMVIMRHMISPSVATRTAVPSVIARVPYLAPNGDPRSDAEPSITAAFRTAGYETYWLSNQAQFGFYENPISFYAADAQHVKFFNDQSYSGAGRYDGVMLPYIKNIVHSTVGKHFIVVHTIGSHFNYSYRYPPGFESFKPAMNPELFKGRTGDGTPSEQLLNSYDNSIYYTDYIISSIINMVNASNASAYIVYVSDHSEDIDTAKQCKYIGTSRKTTSAYKIPAFFWFSHEFRERNYNKIAKIENTADSRVISTVIPQTLLDLADIEITGPRTSSLLDPVGQNRQPREVWSGSRWVNFDQADKTQPCDINSEPLK